MKEILKSPFTWIGVFIVGRYFIRNKPDSSTSNVIREITQGTTQLLDSTATYVTDSVDIVTDTTEDIFEAVQGTGFNAGPEGDPMNFSGSDAFEGSSDLLIEPGSEGISLLNKHNKVDDETTYFESSEPSDSGLGKSNFSTKTDLSDFDDNNPKMS